MKTYSQTLYTAFSSAYTKASDFYQGAKSFTYEMGKECAIQSAQLAPAIALGYISDINFSELFGYGLGFAQICQGSFGLFTTPIQVLKGKVRLLSLDFAKAMSFSALKVSLGTAIFFAPTNTNLEDMSESQFFFWSTLIINSFFTAAYLSKKAYSNLKESHLLEKISPLSKCKETVQWEKVAKAISSTVLSSICFLNAYKNVENLYSQTVFSQIEKPQETEKLQRLLSVMERENIEHFLEINVNDCKKFQNNVSQKYFENYSYLRNCLNQNKAIRDKLLQEDPALLAEIFKAQNEIYNSLTIFLEKAKKYGIDVTQLDRKGFQKVIHLFSCYSDHQLEKIYRATHALLDFDLSRCYEQDEIRLLLDKGILKSAGKGNNLRPAVFLRAESDWNGALVHTELNHHLNEGSLFGSIEFMKDHPTLYSKIIKTSNEMCDAFSKAKSIFGRKIEEIYINAHGSPEGMEFYQDNNGRTHGFYLDTILPTGCFEDNVAEDATVILDSCSTANHEGYFAFFENIAGRIAKLVPKGRVFGAQTPISGNQVVYQLDGEGQSLVTIGEKTVVRQVGDSFSLPHFLFNWIRR